MKRVLIVVASFLTFGVILGIEFFWGHTNYRLNGTTYAVPHKYEFMRQFNLPWLSSIRGLDREPDKSVWLLFPAGELAREVPGYHRLFRGYAGDYDADVVVNVLGGKEAVEFASNRLADLNKVESEVQKGTPREPYRNTGWDRVIWLRGTPGTPGANSSLFYLIPRNGVESMPLSWRPPSCQGSPDIDGHERYDCHFFISYRGMTFIFSLREENVAIANRIPAYVLSWMNQRAS